jgi:hypothetical protein
MPACFSTSTLLVASEPVVTYDPICLMQSTYRRCMPFVEQLANVLAAAAGSSSGLLRARCRRGIRAAPRDKHRAACYAAWWPE